jgi:hypothetical protein
MKIKELEGRIGEEVVYAPPGGRFVDPEVVTVVSIVPPGSVYVDNGTFRGGKNRNPYVEIRFGRGSSKSVPPGHISSYLTPDRFREIEADRAAAREATKAHRADVKKRLMAVEDRLVDLGVLDRPTLYAREVDGEGEEVPSSRLRYSDKLELSVDEFEAIIDLLDGKEAS